MSEKKNIMVYITGKSRKTGEEDQFLVPLSYFNDKIIARFYKKKKMDIMFKPNMFKPNPTTMSNEQKERFFNVLNDAKGLTTQ